MRQCFCSTIQYLLSNSLDFQLRLVVWYTISSAVHQCSGDIIRPFAHSMDIRRLDRLTRGHQTISKPKVLRTSQQSRYRRSRWWSSMPERPFGSNLHDKIIFLRYLRIQNEQDLFDPEIIPLGGNFDKSSLPDQTGFRASRRSRAPQTLPKSPSILDGILWPSLISRTMDKGPEKASGIFSYLLEVVDDVL